MEIMGELQGEGSDLEQDGKRDRWAERTYFRALN